LETSRVPFSLARARNAGLAAVQTSWIFFDDADMVYETAFFSKLHRELTLLHSTPFTFLSLPAVYLSAESSKQVISSRGIDTLLPELLTRLLLEDPRGSDHNHAIQNFAPASAILVMAKETALSVGGYDEGFQGWGGEDRDFIFRLLAANDKLPKPPDFAATRVWNLNDTNEFAGWRALYRLHGDYMARKGYYAFHLYHESNAWRTTEARNRNFERAAFKAHAYADELHGIHQKKPSHEILKHSLLFSIYKDYAVSSPGRSTTKNHTRIMSRLRKLYRDPHAFFRDTRIPYLRSFRHLFAIKENEI